MFLTDKILRAKRACADQRELFNEQFPGGVEVTEDVCVSVADKFDWYWAAGHLLPAPLRADYDAKLASLYADYNAKLASLFGRLAETM